MAALYPTPKLALAAEGHRRGVNAPHPVALVRAGLRFRDDGHVATLEAHGRQVEGARGGIAA